MTEMAPWQARYEAIMGGEPHDLAVRSAALRQLGADLRNTPGTDPARMALLTLIGTALIACETDRLIQLQEPPSAASCRTR